ncbi:unnamed protein product, partial [Ranitomeya imitator]
CEDPIYEIGSTVHATWTGTVHFSNHGIPIYPIKRKLSPDPLQPQKKTLFLQPPEQSGDCSERKDTKEIEEGPTSSLGQKDGDAKGTNLWCPRHATTDETFGNQPASQDPKQVHLQKNKTGLLRDSHTQWSPRNLFSGCRRTFPKNRKSCTPQPSAAPPPCHSSYTFSR